MTPLRSILLAGLVAAFGLVDQPTHAEPSTALDRLNDWTYAFNRGFARTVVSPLLAGVRVLPEPLPQALRNSFDNLAEPVSALSHAMSGDLLAAIESTARFALNSTIGVVGMIDVAAEVGLPARKKHFSEGVCALRLPVSEPVVIIPIAGPSSAGIAAAALVIMAGSTWGLAMVSADLAVASALSDLTGAAAALENSTASADTGGSRAAEATFRSYLSNIGC